MIKDHSLGFNNLPYPGFKDLPYPVLCNRTFSNSTAVPVKLQGYFETNHSVYKENRTEHFKCRHDALFKSPKLFGIAFQTRNVKTTGFRVSYCYCIDQRGTHKCTADTAELHEKSAKESTVLSCFQ